MGGHKINKNLGKKIVTLYIRVSNKSSNRNKYITDLIANLKKVNSGQLKTFEIDLSQINIKNLTELLITHVPDRKKILKLNDEVHYPLNKRTLNSLSKGKIDWNSTDKLNNSDAEIVDMLEVIIKVTLVIPTIEKARPGGSFFKYRNRTHFDLSRYGCHNKVETKNYHRNCLYIALRESGMSRKNFNYSDC